MIILRSEAVLKSGSNMYTMKDINQQGHGRLKNPTICQLVSARPVKLHKSRVSQEDNSSEKQELSLFVIYLTFPFFAHSLEKVMNFLFCRI